MSKFTTIGGAAGSAASASARILRAIATGVVASALTFGALTTPVQAGEAPGEAPVLAAEAPVQTDKVPGNAEKLRRMDIMLMVTGLRCRKTVDNFMDDYGRFTSSHMTELNDANRELRDQFARQFGVQDAARALDRMSVVMANEYGNGHPWLGCAELRQVAKSLAMVQGRETLVEAAGQLLDRRPQPLLALASR